VTASGAREEPERGSLTRKLLHGASWSLLGTVAGQLLSFASNVLVARILGKDAFGEFTIVTGLILTLGTFAGLGLGMTATKYVAEFRQSDLLRAGRIASSLLTLGWVSGFLATVVLFFSSQWVAGNILLSTSLTLPLVLCSPLVALNTVGGIQTALLQGMEKFKASAVVSIVRTGAVALVVVTAGSIWGLTGVLTATVFGTALTILLYAGLLRKECLASGIRLKQIAPFWEERSILINYSLPALLATVVVGPANWAAAMLVARQPGGYAEVGLMAAANQWRQAAILIPQMLTSVLMPLLSAQSAEDTKKVSFTQLLEQSQWISTLVVFPAATITMFGADWVTALYGSGYEGAADLIVITSGTSMIIGMGTSFGAAIQARAMMWLGLAINVCYGVLLIGGTYFFANAYQAKALAWATFASYVLTSLWGFIAMRGHVRSRTMAGLYSLLMYCVVLTGLSYFMQPHLRIWLVCPSTVLSVLVVLTALVPKGELENLIGALKMRLKRVVQG
jgi:O-antigen/teichoic acid export membrane protein